MSAAELNGGEWLTQADVAREMNMAAGHVSRLVKDCKLVTNGKTGRARRVSRASIEAFKRREPADVRREVPINLIRLDGDTQARVQTDAEVIAEYADLYRAGVTLPPVKLVHDGMHYWPVEGHHRIPARLAAGFLVVDAEVTKGTKEDAEWEATAANKTHGLRRSSADKRNAIIKALKHPHGAELSDVAIADHIGVNDKTVAKYRAELESGSEIPRVAQRTGRDGKSYPVAAPAPAAVPAPVDAAIPAPAAPAVETAADAVPARPIGSDGANLMPTQERPDDEQSDAIPTRDFTALIRYLGEAKAMAEKIASTPAGAFLRMQDFEIKLCNVQNVLRQARPHAVCKRCRGVGCKVCHDSGFVPKNIAESQGD